MIIVHERALSSTRNLKFTMSSNVVNFIEQILFGLANRVHLLFIYFGQFEFRLLIWLHGFPFVNHESFKYSR